MFTFTLSFTKMSLLKQPAFVDNPDLTAFGGGTCTTRHCKCRLPEEDFKLLEHLGRLWFHHQSKRCFVAVYFSAKVSYWYVKRLWNAAKNHTNMTKKWGGPPSGRILWVSCDINVWRRIRCVQRSNLLLGKMARMNPFTSFQKKTSHAGSYDAHRFTKTDVGQAVWFLSLKFEQPDPPHPRCFIVFACDVPNVRMITSRFQHGNNLEWPSKMYTLWSWTWKLENWWFPQGIPRSQFLVKSFPLPNVIPSRLSRSLEIPRKQNGCSSTAPRHRNLLLDRRIPCFLTMN